MKVISKLPCINPAFDMHMNMILTCQSVGKVVENHKAQSTSLVTVVWSSNPWMGYTLIVSQVELWRPSVGNEVKATKPRSTNTRNKSSNQNNWIKRWARGSYKFVFCSFSLSLSLSPLLEVTLECKGCALLKLNLGNQMWERERDCGLLQRPLKCCPLAWPPQTGT